MWGEGMKEGGTEGKELRKEEGRRDRSLDKSKRGREGGWKGEKEVRRKKKNSCRAVRNLPEFMEAGIYR